MRIDVQEKNKKIERAFLPWVIKDKQNQLAITEYCLRVSQINQYKDELEADLRGTENWFWNRIPCFHLWVNLEPT